MGETRYPNTPFLVFVFFFTFTVATRTTDSINCQTGLLRYPFGFSDGYPIRFNCSKNSFAKIGEFSVNEVTSANIYMEIPMMCTREISKFEQLFCDNFAPSTFQNIIFVHGCDERSPDCSVACSFNRCNSKLSCLDGAMMKTADVMSIGEFVNRSGCKYWFTSVTQSRSTKQGSSLTFERLNLDWWLKEGCTNTTCSENANCTQVKLHDGGLGHRCTCLDGFQGDAFTVYGGCRQESDCSTCKNSGGVCGYNQTTRAFVCYCVDGHHNRYCGYRKKGRSYKAKIGLGITSIFVGLVVAGGLLCFISWRKKTSDDRRQQNLEALIPLKRYSYAQVKKITNSFVHVVGKGGVGTVYRGTLCDGRSVAVKVLKDSKANGEDFMNEVASMSKTSHANTLVF